MEQPVILNVEQVRKAYRSGEGTLDALKNVSFSLAARDTCAIVGPSGSGKTTLLGLCAGLDLPTSGEVTLDSTPLSNLSEDDRAKVRNRSVGFVFQSFRLLPTLTALENVMIPLELRNESSPLDKAREMLNQVGLKDRSAHYPSQLSGGEQQRVALARAFVTRPKILFADEPTGNLDDETAGRVTQVLFDLNTQFGSTLVLVTHDLELAQRARRIIKLRGGAISEDSSIAGGRA